jgi:heat shock protein HslJ
VSISHDGATTPVPAATKYAIYLQFTPDGHFGANDPVNYHSGSYQVTRGGFTTGSLMNTAMGYIGHDPVILLSMSAISAFDGAVHVKADVSGNTLTVTVGGYTLMAQRDGRQANF